MSSCRFEPGPMTSGGEFAIRDVPLLAKHARAGKQAYEFAIAGLPNVSLLATAAGAVSGKYDSLPGSTARASNVAYIRVHSRFKDG